MKLQTQPQQWPRQSAPCKGGRLRQLDNDNLVGQITRGKMISAWVVVVAVYLEKYSTLRIPISSRAYVSSLKPRPPIESTPPSVFQHSVT